jgi:GNAT superfamily N-acetyltransferase
MYLQFRKARHEDLPEIWTVLQQAILRRKADNSTQWQDGYPNPDVVLNDIDCQIGYVLTNDSEVIGYCAVLVNDEPEYAKIKGKWITEGDFLIVHRVAIADAFIGRGLSYTIVQQVEELAQRLNIHSIRMDTNFDNHAMLRVIEKSGFTYCGEVYFRGSARRAYEKKLP